MYSLARLSEQPNKRTPEKCLFSGVLAHLRGFEPLAYRLGGGRSILLSYGNSCGVFNISSGFGAWPPSNQEAIALSCCAIGA